MSDSERPAGHGMLLLGTNKVYASHLAMFAMPEHGYQAILELELDSKDKETYLNTKRENPSKPLIIMNRGGMLLKDIVNSGNEGFDARMSFADDDGNPVKTIIESVKVPVKKSLLFTRLNPTGDNYPEFLSYYLYGINPEFHLSHVLTKAPNFQQEMDVSLHDVDFSGNRNKTVEDIMNGVSSGLLTVSIPDLEERNKQHIKQDPLDKSEYTIKIPGIPTRTSHGDSTGKISITNKFWINNISLNQGFADHMHMDMHNM
jgi:hypothetical protein